MVVCQYFLKGDCRFGDKCRYEHPSATRKTVCTYFLNGNCRFGDRCHNEHPRGEGFQHSDLRERFRQTQQTSEQWSRSYYNQNRFDALSTRPRESADSDLGNSQIQQTVKNDMEIWDRSKQWPLSCYTYTKEEPSLPGLLDFCPEEIRLEAYTANAKGNADSYKQGLKQLISENHKRRHQLSKMTVSEIEEEIKKNTMLHQHKAVSMDAGSSIQQTTSGFFSVSSSFTQPGTTLSPATGSIFQSAGNPTHQSGLFGQTKASAVKSASVFGDTNNSTGQSGDLFGVSSAGQAGMNLIALPSATPSGRIFSSDSKPQKESSTVSESLDSLKSNQETVTSVENSTKVASDRQKLTCSEQDMQAFMADSFVLGKIPECPPPFELC